MEHPRAVVPVREHGLVRPAVAHHVAQTQRLELREGFALRRRDVGLPGVGGGIEHVLVGRGDVEVAADHRRLRAVLDQLPKRRQPGELVAVVIGVRNAAVRHVHRDHPDAAAGRGDRSGLGSWEARRALTEPGHDLIEPDARENGHPVPGRLAVERDGIVPLGERIAEQLAERVVGELGLLQADDVRPPLVQPRQQSRHTLLDRVDVPGRDSQGHARYLPLRGGLPASLPGVQIERARKLIRCSQRRAPSDGRADAAGRLRTCREGAGSRPSPLRPPRPRALRNRVERRRPRRPPACSSRAETGCDRGSRRGRRGDQVP